LLLVCLFAVSSLSGYPIIASGEITHSSTTFQGFLITYHKDICAQRCYVCFGSDGKRFLKAPGALGGVVWHSGYIDRDRGAKRAIMIPGIKGAPAHSRHKAG
jgi:hypothetical protein